MDVTDLVQRLLRRWPAAVLVVLIAVLSAGAAYTSADSTQQSTATLVIVPPVLGVAVADQNPLLNLDNNLAQLATVLESAMTSSRAGAAVGAGGASFDISTLTGPNPSSAQLSPQLVFTVTATTPEAAVATSRALVAEAADRLDQLQSEAGTPFASRARLVTVVSPTPAEFAGSGGLRAGGAVGLGTLVLGLLALLLVDEMFFRRTTRRPR